jgi:signal transduction histidine kinase
MAQLGPQAAEDLTSCISAGRAPDNDPGVSGRLAFDDPVTRKSMHRRGHRVGPGAIATKVLAVVVGLLLASLMAGAGLVYQAVDLGRPDPEREALLATRDDVNRLLIAAHRTRDSWHSFLLAGTNEGLRVQRQKEYVDAHEGQHVLIEKLLDDAVTSEERAQLVEFEVKHEQAHEVYEGAMKVFLDAGGKARGAVVADAATRNVEVVPFDGLTKYGERVTDLAAKKTEERVARVGDRVRVIVVLGLLGFLVLAAVMMDIVRRVVRPIRELASVTEEIANRKLPAAVAQIKQMREGDPPPLLDPVQVRSRDETALLAAAFQSLQDSALALALEQQQAHLDSAQMLVNLGWRNQNLLNRTLAYITELERTEQDPEILERLFLLDHATTRIRRNAESMLVLAGAAQTRTRPSPETAADVIRAALSEIEDYNRVDIYYVQDIAMTGIAVADVVHLLAELLENATTFSPPSTRVTVVGQTVADGYRIRIIDEGIGMTNSELEASNRTIRLAAEGRSVTKLLGLYVVGRLAARRGIDVVLETSGARGVTVNVILPRTLLASMPERSRPSPEVPRQALPPTPHPFASRSGRERLSAVAPVAGNRSGSAGTSAGTGGNGSAGAAGNGSAGTGGNGSAGAVRRVPGAQLPDLGGDPQVGPSPSFTDLGDVRERLSSFQSGSVAGREAAGTMSRPGESVPGEIPVPESPPSDARRPHPAAGASTSPPHLPGAGNPTSTSTWFWEAAEAASQEVAGPVPGADPVPGTPVNGAPVRFLGFPDAGGNVHRADPTGEEL